MERTQPKPRFPKDVTPDPSTLAAGRYGTADMVEIWGAERTMEYQLRVQGQAARTLNKLHPDVISADEAELIYSTADLTHIDPDDIRRIEEKTGHDIIAVNTALEAQLSLEAAAHVNKAKTSADTTQPARALQLKDSLEVIIDSTENLRDILREKAVAWNDILHMDTSHLYDALPTVAGRPLVHYVEMLQSGLDLLKYVYDNSIIGKWADATGNHHSATALGIDGIELQQKYCDDLGIGHMTAPAQLPGLEFEGDIWFALTRIGETMNNIARYVVWGKSDDVDIFRDANPKRRKGSSAMPHKDAKGGNPTAEEQVMSICNYLRGNMMTALVNCEMPYARNLAASANSRINFEDGFKFLDHGLRRLASAVYWLEVDEEKSRERVERTYGVTTSQRVMTYLTDPRQVEAPMTRSEAHNLMAELATHAYESKIPFVDVLLADARVTTHLSEETIRELTDPTTYIGQSKEIINIV